MMYAHYVSSKILLIASSISVEIDIAVDLGGMVLKMPELKYLLCQCSADTIKLYWLC